MHENVCMIIPHDNQVQLLPGSVNDSSIAHLSDPSPLKFPQISRKIGSSIYIIFNTKYPLQKHKP